LYGFGGINGPETFVLPIHANTTPFDGGVEGDKIAARKLLASLPASLVDPKHKSGGGEWNSLNVQPGSIRL
jgi:hypothetical protein